MKPLQISSSPHIRHKATTRILMRDVLIALLPAAVCAVAFFGYRSLLVMGISALSAVLAEMLCNKVMKRPDTTGDLSAVVTGVLYAMVLPVGAPVYMILFGSVFSIVIAKQLFGGIGANIVNPALAGRAFMSLSFPSQFSNNLPLDAVSSATPLAGSQYGYWDLLVGNYGGMIGETAKLAIIAGFLYLLVRGVISWRIPVVTMASAVLFSYLTGRDPLFDLLTGGLLFGAVFMATDYVTSPLLPLGQVVYAVGVGAITVLIRAYGSYPEGCMYAILLMNITTPLIDRLIKPRAFGEQKTSRHTA